MENEYSFDKQEIGIWFNIIVEEAIPKEEQLEGNGVRKFAYIKAGFTTEKDAQEYCEFKNRKKINKDFADQMINHYREECFTQSKWLNDEYENLIEIIKSLRSKE